MFPTGVQQAQTIRAIEWGHLNLNLEWYAKWNLMVELWIGLFKACVRYFSLFLKDKCISSLFRTKYIENKFNLVVFSSHLFSPGLPRATRLLETSCLEKITVCVIETMLVTLPLVQMNKARRKWTEETKYKPR